ncbi:MAG: endonuclease/exonuclease/phosphatase family protein, partial [Lentimicrobium sp.]|nr:endonuclease/exonuclease/phosphatase family protein [Lentimicrobium sp.]
FWPIAFIGLAFPIFWIITLISALILIRTRRWFLFLIIVLLATTPMMLKHFNLPVFKNRLHEAEYSVLTYNVHGFAGVRNGKSSYERQVQIHDFVNKINPTVVCIQEYAMKSRKHARYIEFLNNGLKLPNKHLSDFDAEFKGTSYTFLTASTFPIIKQGNIFTMESEICGIFSDIQFPEGIIRVYNIHLESVKLISEKKLLRPHRNPGILKDFLTPINGAIRKLRKAFPTRAYEAWMIAESIRKCPYPVIVAGDFNDTPASYAYEMLSKNMNDAAINRSFGFQRTYAESLYPIRIDHVLVDKSLEIKSYERRKIYLSDHFPVIAGFSFKE